LALASWLLIFVASCLASCLQVQGRILFPAAAMLEMTLAAASSAYQPDAVPSQQLALMGASIAAPLVMTAGAGVALTCTLRYGSGELELASGTSGAMQRRHMAAQAGGLSCLLRLLAHAARPPSLFYMQVVPPKLICDQTND
jgi:hypothetical protein